MLEHSEYMPLEYIKKQKWTGSFQGMRFLLHRVTESVQEETEDGTVEKEQSRLEAVVWKEPFSYEHTPEEVKQRQRFAFSEEGRKESIQWLEACYEEQREIWRQAMKWDWEQENS